MDRPPLSDEAMDVLRRARAAAAGQGHERAGLDSILIAVADAPTGRRLLELFDADPERTKAGITFIAGHGGSPQDRDAEERTVDLARDEAASLGHRETGAEHLLLGLARQHGSIASGMLEALGVTLVAAREGVRFLHGELPDWQPPPSEASGGGEAWSPLMADDSPEAIEAAMAVADAIRPFEAGMGRLRRVIGVGQVRESGRVVVELIALELRDTMAVLSYRSHGPDDVMDGPPSASISDDLGTQYDVLPARWQGGSQDGGGEVWLTPCPPDTATMLRVEMAAVEGPGWHFPPLSLRESQPLAASQGVTGPWRFEVALHVGPGGGSSS